MYYICFGSHVICNMVFLVKRHKHILCIKIQCLQGYVGGTNHHSSVCGGPVPPFPSCCPRDLHLCITLLLFALILCYIMLTFVVQSAYKIITET